MARKEICGVQPEVTMDPEVVAAGESLVGARAQGDWVQSAEIIDRWGIDLAHSQFAEVLFDVAAKLPLDLGASRPGLALRFEDIGRIPIGSTPLGLPRTPAEAREEFARNGDLRLRQAVLPLATRRRLGRFDEAMEIARAALPLAEASIYPWYGGKSQILPYWYLQVGITAQLAGDLDGARRYFLSAWSHRARDPYGFVARATAGRLAQQDAIYGDHIASSVWLERAGGERRRADLWVDQFAESTMTSVRTIAAIDGLDPEVEMHLNATLQPSQRTEHWAFLLWIFVQHTLSDGDLTRARRHLREALAARAPELSRTGLAAGLIPLMRAEIHLAMGQGHQALRALDKAPDVAGLTVALRARTLLLAGQGSAALAALEELGKDSTASPRARAEAALVTAAAHMEAGNRDAAVGAARSATSHVQKQGSPRLLATVPRATLESLAPDVPALGPLLALLHERAVRDIYPADVQFVSITERERDLLRALGSGQTLAEIAQSQFVSVNTTRTHLANLRRKLGARSRGEVLTAAQRLGLLDR